LANAATHLDEALRYILGLDGVWNTTADDIAEYYIAKPSGLGMGLPICRSIIEAHGGRLWATANVPRGAVFQFTVPTRPDPASK
jgi:K+-sensing histidine kinase KdpD